MPNAKTVNDELEHLSYRGSKSWEIIPSHMKEIDFINESKDVTETRKHGFVLMQTLQS